MSDIIFNQYPQFFTATILEWQHLLEDDSMKDIIIESLSFLVKDGRVIVYGFAPIAMGVPNHIHLIWQIKDKHVRNKVQQNFLKFTAQKMKFRIIDTGDARLDNYKVKAADREYLPIAIGMGTQSFKHRFTEPAGIRTKAELHAQQSYTSILEAVCIS